MPNILFATNRTPTGTLPGGLTGFGDTALAATPGNLWCGTVEVDGTDQNDANAGNIKAFGDLNQGAFAPAALAAILASQNDILVFVHGTDNSFEEAVLRADYNSAWLAAGSNPAIDVVLFTWPARSYGSYVNLFADHADYDADQQQAALTPYHFHLFLDQLRLIQPHLGKRKLHLLCHSMGNYMLGDALDRLFAADPQPALPHFEEIILAAADEDYRSLHLTGGGRLSNLWRLGREITVYFNNGDTLMLLSQSPLVNDVQRLGYAGPNDAANLQIFPSNVYEFVDCTGCTDYVKDAPLVSHQYYRESRTVRADIVATLAGATPKRPPYNATANVHPLFPPQAVASTDRPGGTAA
ncbi:MAG: alpha/beta hydrolase [Nevskiales bacterium]